MSFGGLGAFLLVLIVVFVFGNLWFHLVETLLKWGKHLLMGNREPQAWHPLPTEEQESEDRKKTK